MITIISRRKFIGAGCCSLAALGAMSMVSRLGLVNAFAQSPSYRALVCIFLFGGNDGNNMIVPTDSRYSGYSSIRGALAIPQGSLIPISTAGAGAFGVNPSMPELATLYNSGAAAFVANAGTLIQPTTPAQFQANSVPLPDSLFSHSDQQTQNQSSIAAALLSTSGWGGRTADILQPAAATFPVCTSVAGNNLFVDGANTTPATIIPGGSLALSGSWGTPGSNARDSALQQLLGFDAGFSMVTAANDVTSNGLHINQVLTTAFATNPPLATAFPDTNIGNEMKQIAQIIQARAALGVSNQIFFASLGGFDTHSAQLPSQDPLLAQLSAAISAFYSATVEIGVANSVTTFTQSDFSRTFQPNTNAGTDHAWGNNLIVAGGAVKGGDLYGTFPTLALSGPDDAIDRGAWVPTTSIDQYGATLAAWFGLSSSNLASVFPNLKNFSTQNLGFV
jgi:uncharacterized protein (DUF1501 family)